MTWAVAIALAGGTIGVLLAMLQAGRLKVEAAKLHGQLDVSSREVEAWKGKTAALGAEVERLRKIGIDAQKRSVEVERILRSQLDEMVMQLAKCSDPVAIRSMLNGLFVGKQ